MRVPEVEDVLSQLRGSRVVSFWKQRLKCSQLSHDEIDSLLDPNIVDWFHFHTGYLESICNRQATSKSNACERSHDQIDDLFQLAKDLQRAHPENIASASTDKKNQWQSCVDHLAMEYQRTFNNKLQHGIADLPTRVRDILARPWSPEDNMHAETIYYVAGAIMKMIDNLAKRSKDIYTNALNDIKTNSATTKLDARNGSLPSGKVEAKESYCLCYANQTF